MTTKEQIIEQLDTLNENQLQEILRLVLMMKNRSHGVSGRLFLERTKDIHFDQDMIDAIEEEFPIKRSSLNE